MPDAGPEDDELARLRKELVAFVLTDAVSSVLADPAMRQSLESGIADRIVKDVRQGLSLGAPVDKSLEKSPASNGDDSLPRVGSAPNLERIKHLVWFAAGATAGSLIVGGVWFAFAYSLGSVAHAPVRPPVSLPASPAPSTSRAPSPSPAATRPGGSATR